MRGRRRHVSSVLADALAGRPSARSAATAAAFSDAVGPGLAREVSVRGALRDGRLLIVASSANWAAQVTALEPEILGRLRERLGSRAPTGLCIHVAAEGT